MWTLSTLPPARMPGVGGLLASIGDGEVEDGDPSQTEGRRRRGFGSLRSPREGILMCQEQHLAGSWETRGLGQLWLSFVAGLLVSILWASVSP